MTVRIIDPNPDPSVVRRAVCGNCGVKVEYTPQDLKEDYHSDYLGDRDYYKYVGCPSCGKQIIHREQTRFF